MGSRDAEAMSSCRGDYDAGGMVWGSLIGKKLFGGSGLPSGPGLASGVSSRALGLLARSCPVGGRQVGGMWSKNRRRKDLASEVLGL